MSILKKAAAAISFQLLLSAGEYFPGNEVKAADKPLQINNIVLFAQFEGTDSYNFMAENTDKMIGYCNNEETFRSLSGYIDGISYGQAHVTSYFPQLKDGVIIPYQLSQGESSYMNCEQYAIEMVKNIAVSADIPLDGNSDGIVDNIMLVIDGQASSMDSPIWSKAFTVTGMDINGCSTGTFNIHNSHQLFENLISGGEGVICHEFMHSIGYPDLYRNGRGGTPVGMWDIMASNSIFLQYPLAYQRASISRWLDYREITENGTFTLSPAGNAEGDRLYLLKTPLSSTEFFAVEYRKQGARYSSEPDVKIYGSGLVVYRVNTEADGNFKSTDDQIYVFRPDETSLDAGEGDITRSNYGGENAPDHVGSLDWNDGVSEGALVYSNGTNSGILLKNITINGDELTFEAEFADNSQAQLWSSLSCSSLGNFSPYQLLADGNDKVHLLAADNGKAQLFCENETGFEAEGAAIGSGRMNDMYMPRMTFCGDVPYVMYRDKDFIVHICKNDISGNSVSEIYKGSELAQYAEIASIGDKIYLAYTIGSFPYKLYCAEIDTATGNVSELGGIIAGNACNMTIGFDGNAPVIAYRDISDGNSSKLAVYTDGMWSTMTVSEMECGAVTGYSDNNGFWIAPCGRNNSVYLYSGGSVTEYPLPTDAVENAFMQTVTGAGGRIYTAVNTQSPAELSVYVLEGNSWKAVGDTLAREVVNEVSLAGGKDSLYCSYTTSNGTAIVKKLAVENDARVIGDVNADGKFSVADLVALQKYLLGSGSLAAPEEGDLYSDDVIDVFDIIIMRKMLI